MVALLHGGSLGLKSGRARTTSPTVRAVPVAPRARGDAAPACRRRPSPRRVAARARRRPPRGLRCLLPAVRARMAAAVSPWAVAADAASLSAPSAAAGEARRGPPAFGQSRPPPPRPGWDVPPPPRGGARGRGARGAGAGG